jgi:hypothetical protein
MKNIFSLCAGRTSFAKACSHIFDVTSAHETLVGVLGTRRLSYPSQHIEIDNRLVWFLQQLDKTFADKNTLRSFKEK